MTTELTPRSNADIQPHRARMGRLMGIQIVGVGSYVPDNTVKNEDLTQLGCDADWIVQRTGIRERRHAPPEVATSDMAVEAARRCIDNAGVDPKDIDLLLVGTFTPDMPLPSTACLVQDRLGLRAPAMDIHAACAGFIYSMVTATQFIATGSSKLALVIGADCNSRVVNPSDVRTYPLFGDGAGASLLAAGDDSQGLISYGIGSDGSGASLLCQKMGGTRLPFTADGDKQGLHFLQMDGRPIFKWAIRILRESIADVLEAADMTLGDIDLVIFHQANMRIIRSAVKDLGVDPNKVYNNVDRFGNTAAASIPLALDEVCRQGRLKRGDHLLLSGFGAGLAWGTVLMRW